RPRGLSGSGFVSQVLTLESGPCTSGGPSSWSVGGVAPVVGFCPGGCALSQNPKCTNPGFETKGKGVSGFWAVRWLTCAVTKTGVVWLGGGVGAKVKHVTVASKWLSPSAPPFGKLE